MAEEKDNSEENKKRALLALAVLIGADVDDYSQLALPENKAILQRVESKLEAIPSLQEAVSQPERITEQKLQTEMAKASIDDGVKLMRVVTVGDDKVCPKCKEWQDKIVTVEGNDPNYPSVREFINSGGLHYNCRCSLQQLETSEIPLNKLNPRYEERRAANPSAYNTSISCSQLVFN